MLIRFGCGDDANIETEGTLDFVDLDFREDRLVSDTECVIAIAIEGFWAHTAEVTNHRNGDFDETLQEFKHDPATESDFDTNRFVFTKLEVGHAVLGLGDDGLLTCDRGNIVDSVFNRLLAVRLGANAAIDDDFFDLGNEVDVRYTQLAFEMADYLLVVKLLEIWFGLAHG